MDRNVSIDLAQYADIRATYVPKIGDFIIKHGWINRTKWFGIINGIEQDGTIKIIRSGMPRIVLQMEPSEMEENSIMVKLSDIKNSYPGTYSIVQHNTQNNVVVWYV